MMLLATLSLLPINASVVSFAESFVMSELHQER
jgi:hypothetical protein